MSLVLIMLSGEDGIPGPDGGPEQAGGGQHGPGHQDGRRVFQVNVQWISDCFENIFLLQDQ